LFDDAFPERPDAERVTEETAGLAIAAYERTLVAYEAPFQRWLRGETDAMTDAEKRGALLFFGEGACVACHSGPALASNTFHAVGLGDLSGSDLVGTYDPLDPVHLGRGGFTGRDADRYRFKTPQLYNLADHVAFGHGATLLSIREVVAYKNAGVAQVPYFPTHRLSPHFHPLRLTEAEVDDLTAFLERGLYDPRVDRYVPAAVPSGQCFPANDDQSRRDLGCDDAARTPR
jgi:cytochrome c peroxidase